MKHSKGMTLLELMVVMAISTIAISATLGFLAYQTKRTSQETAKTRSVQANILYDLIITRDIVMAGLGMPVEASGNFVPVSSNNNYGQNGSDELVIKGAGISYVTDDYRKWGYNTVYISSGDTAVTVTSGQENPISGYPSFPQFEKDDQIIFLNAENKEILSNKVYKITNVSGNLLSLDSSIDFTINEKNAFIFSIGGISVTDFPDYLNTFTGYRLNNTAQNLCAPNAFSLCRVYESSMPLLDCVLDFQVQFGLIQSDGTVNWVNDISGYSSATLNDQLKLVRAVIVLQSGKKDLSYTYPDNTITVADHTNNLTTEQRHYRWRIVRLDTPLRELQ